MPQVSHDQGWNIFTQGNDFKGLIYNFNQRDKFPDEFIVPSLIAEKKAKVSDFLQLGSLTIGTFIASERCKKILDELKIPKHQLYPTVAIFGTGELTYYIYHFYQSDNDYIDFDSTRFSYFLPGRPNELIKDESVYEKYDSQVEFNLKGMIEFNLLKSNITEPYVGIGVTSLVLKELDSALDLIYIKDCGVLNFFISDVMKETLVRNKITGWALNSEGHYYMNGIHDYKSY